MVEQEPEKIIYKAEWFDKLVEDCKYMMVDTKQNIMSAVLHTRWLIGDRISVDYNKFKRSKYGNKTQRDLAVALGTTQQRISELIRFREMVGNDFDKWSKNTDT